MSSLKGTSGYWLDYGSLLGLYRDGGIIPWEFDMDMGVLDSECDQFLSLKGAMLQDGLTMYARGEYVAAKESKIMGYDGYMHATGARIYDKEFKLYVDVYWYKRFTYEQAQEEARAVLARGDSAFRLPPGYTEEDGDVLCNLEAWEESSPSGGCKLARWIFPLQPRSLLGLPQWVPADSPAALTVMYGEDWMVPRPKGYKMLMCGWMPTSAWKFMLLLALVCALPAAILLRPLIREARASVSSTNKVGARQCKYAPVATQQQQHAGIDDVRVEMERRPKSDSDA